MPNTLYIIPCAGLANRLRAIVSAASAAADAGIPLCILWKREHSIFNAPFRECFDMASLPEWITVQEGFVESGNKVCKIRSESEWEQYRATAEKQGSPLVIKSHQAFYKGVSWNSLLRKIRPHPSIVESADTLLAWAERLVGVHIRRTDHARAIRESPSVAFWTAMDAEPADTIFYIASDSEEERQVARLRYPGRIITGARRLGRTEPVECLDAVLDLYCLSRCSKVIGSSGSSFSEMAALWGDIK